MRLIFRCEIEELLRYSFDNDCCAIAEDLSDTGGDLGGSIAHRDNGIGANLEGMLDHTLIGIRARLLAQFGVNGNVPATDLLEGRANVADDTPRAQTDAAQEGKVPPAAIAV